MLRDALILLIGSVIGVLVDWVLTGFLPQFNRRNVGLVLALILVLLIVVVWNAPRDSVSVTVPRRMPLRSALTFIAESRGSTINYSAECALPMQKAILREGTLTAGDLSKALELAQHRLAEGSPKVNYSVTHDSEKGLYEIRCY